jgi:uncharacterized membrane protein
MGESWFTHTIHQKGFDSFTTSAYTEGATVFLESMRSMGHTVDYIPSHEISRSMPSTPAQLAEYGTVVISDVGANTFLLQPATFDRSEIVTNLLVAVAEYVADGGGLVMVGGYMSFAGIDGRARFGDSPLASVLPVTIQASDDRVETPQGSIPQVVRRHPIVDGLPETWPLLLGYNRVLPRDESTTLVTCNNDPLLVIGNYGKGRDVAFMSDLAPHWAPPGFLMWPSYPLLWSSILSWASGFHD